jgi:hypothetical protein
MDLDRGALSTTFEVRPVRVRRIQAERRNLYREYGYSLPFNPLVKGLELLSTPFLFGLGAVLVYQYWTEDEETGGVGDGDAASIPEGPMGFEDVGDAAREGTVDLVVRDPSVGSLFRRTDFPFLDWWLLTAEAADPFHTSRALFPERRTFGPVGDVYEGAWKVELREEEETIAGAKPAVFLAGAPVEGERGDGEKVTVALRGRGTGPLVFTAEAAIPGGGKAETRLEVEAAYLEALEKAESLRAALAANPADAGARLALADLHAAWGGGMRALRETEAALAAGAPPAEGAVRLKAAYGAMAREAFRAGDAGRAFFLDALAEFHAEIAGGAWADWEERGKTPERLLVEGLGAGSALVRARAAALAAGLDAVPAEDRTAALLASVRGETNPLALWACLWALERCGTAETAEALEKEGKGSADPVLEARAQAAAEAIRRRELAPTTK